MKSIFCFDIDSVICKTTKSIYSKSIPNLKVISFINSLYDQGYEIKIFTARYMGRFNSDVLKVKKYGYKKTEQQLQKWNLKYHKLILGKPNFDIFVDDKALGFKKNWINDFKKKLKKNESKNKTLV